jgi:hypothetical protein
LNTGSSYVAQVGLNLLGSSNLPSQATRATGSKSSIFNRRYNIQKDNCRKFPDFMKDINLQILESTNCK